MAVQREDIERFALQQSLKIMSWYQPFKRAAAQMR